MAATTDGKVNEQAFTAKGAQGLPYFQAGDQVELTLTKWIAQTLAAENFADKAMMTRELTGVVTAASAKAVRFTGCASTRPAEFCHRCGREITNPTSRYCGYGPICSDYLGIPRDEVTEEELVAIRGQVAENTKLVDVWIPKSKILAAEIIPTETPAMPEPTPAPTPTAPAAKPDAVGRLDGGTLVIQSDRRYADLHKAFPSHLRRWNPERAAWVYTPGHMNPADLAYAIRAAFAEAGAQSFRADAGFKALVLKGKENALAGKA